MLCARTCIVCVLDTSDDDLTRANCFCFDAVVVAIMCFMRGGESLTGHFFPILGSKIGWSFDTNRPQTDGRCGSKQD